MKRFSGTRTPDGCHVTVHEDGKPARRLPLHLGIRNHSPTGFEWGYGGSGPAQLALAICYEVLRDRGAALALYQAYKWDVVARLTGSEWTLTEAEVRAAVAPALAERKRDERGR